MEHVLRTLFYGSWFMPHGHCYLWQPRLVALHVASDALIGAAYLLISAVLYALVRRIRLPFSTMIVAFGVFIGACGLTHIVEVWNVWHSAYWLAGWVKALTAVASVATGAYLLQARATIVRVADAARLAEERRVELEAKNRELEELSARLRDADRLKTEFFANVSHELRTPLALILGPVDRLLEREPLSAGGRDDLDVVRRNARLLLRHVNALLDAAKLEAGRVTARYAGHDLAELVRLCAANFRSLAEERGVALEVEADGAVRAEVDVEKVERVVLNLLSNAFKFTPPGGRVRCSLTASGGRATLVVDDSGPGVPEALREAVFERFRQASTGASREFGGTGLGLSIAREFARLHGGSVTAGDSPLGGARFVVELPLAAPEGAPVEADAAPPPEALAAEARDAAEALRPSRVGAVAADGDGDRPRALVVEDTADMRAFVARALAEDFRVDTAADGEEGLRKAGALRPDVVVTDIMMPRMSGDELVRRAREDPALAATPFLLLSARADDALRVELLRAGAQDYLVKPFLAAELVARARNLAAMKRARDALEGALAARSGDLEALARELAARTRQVETALEAAGVARLQAERAAHAKGTLLGLVSHELRTPLSVLELGVHALGRADPGRRPELLDRVARATARLKSTYEAVVEFTRAESGGLVARPSEVDLARLAREVVDDLRPDAQRKLLALDGPGDGDALALRTDGRLVRLIVASLVSNAIKYTDEGSVEVRLSGDGGGARVAVADTGRGIAPEERRRLFEPFDPLEPLRHKGSAGLGVGLWLVRQMAAALGGEVTVTSEPGRGSTFTLSLAPLPE